MIKKYFPSFAFFMSLTIAISSCTVEKRVHLPGYHIDWFGKKKEVASLKKAKNEESVSTNFQKEEVDMTIVEKFDSVNLTTASVQDIPVFKAKHHHPVVKAHTTIKQVVPVAWSEKKFEPFCISSTALAIVAFVVPAELVLFLFLAAFLAGVIGLVRVLRNRDRFRGMLFAILGILTSVLIIVGLIVALASFT